jgi:hypothetical protein
MIRVWAGNGTNKKFAAFLFIPIFEFDMTIIKKHTMQTKKQFPQGEGV